MPPCDCSPTRLCDLCFDRERGVKMRQAEVVGQTWAERVARRPEHRGHTAWPLEGRAVDVARRLVTDLARADSRLLEDLAAACIAGAATWWERRPASRRDWSLVTAPDELERCCVVVAGERCQELTRHRIVGPGGEFDDVTFTCAGHLELVRRRGDVVTAAASA